MPVRTVANTEHNASVYITTMPVRILTTNNHKSTNCAGPGHQCAQPGCGISLSVWLAWWRQMVSVGRIWEIRGEAVAAVIVVMMGMVGMAKALFVGEQWVGSNVVSAV